MFFEARHYDILSRDMIRTHRYVSMHCKLFGDGCAFIYTGWLLENFTVSAMVASNSGVCVRG
jgi:hypothetical protein